METLEIEKAGDVNRNWDLDIGNQWISPRNSWKILEINGRGFPFVEAMDGWLKSQSKKSSKKDDLDVPPWMETSIWRAGVSVALSSL